MFTVPVLLIPADQVFVGFPVVISENKSISRTLPEMGYVISENFPAIVPFPLEGLNRITPVLKKWAIQQLPGFFF